MSSFRFPKPADRRSSRNQSERGIGENRHESDADSSHSQGERPSAGRRFSSRDAESHSDRPRRDSRDNQDARGGRDHRETRGSRDSRNDTDRPRRDSPAARGPRNFSEARDTRDSRDSQDARSFRGSRSDAERPRRDAHGSRPSRDFSDTRDSRDSRNEHGRPPRDGRGFRESRPEHGRPRREGGREYGEGESRRETGFVRGDRSSEHTPERRHRPDMPRDRAEREGQGRPHEHTGGRRGESHEKRRPHIRSAEGPGHDRPFVERSPRGQSPRQKGDDTTSQEQFISQFPAGEAPVLLPGAKPVLELLASAPHRVDAVFLRKGRHSKDMERIADACRLAGVRFSLLETLAFSKIYPGKSQGVVARLFEAGFTDFDELLDGIMNSPMPLLLVLDQVQDPGNAGTLARTLYALGGAGMVVPRHNGAYLGAGAAKAAAGALEKLPVAKVANLGQALDAAKERGITIYGAVGEPQAGATPSTIPSQNIFSLIPRLPAVLVLGGEEDGIRPSTEKRCDMLVRIPMLRDFDSLNVAQAGAIILGWFAHKKGSTGAE